MHELDHSLSFAGEVPVPDTKNEQHRAHTSVEEKAGVQMRRLLVFLIIVKGSYKSRNLHRYGQRVNNERGGQHHVGDEQEEVASVLLTNAVVDPSCPSQIK